MITPPSFLTDVLPLPLPERPYGDDDEGQRPWVTLTYAQSLDAKIAGIGGTQLILSGSESMRMTHWMRTMHDAILVGIGTALNDNPQLNTRHVPDSASRPAPRPVILDPSLQLPTDCMLLLNYAAKTGRRPWIFCAQDADPARRLALEAAGAIIHSLPRATHGLDLRALLRSLHELGIRSLMVEGGQRVISSFYSLSGAPLVDMLIVTVAPTLVGPKGVGVALDDIDKIVKVVHVKSEIMGIDTVVACRVIQ